MRDEKQINEVKSATQLRFSELWKNNFHANQTAIQRHPPIARLAKKFKELPGIVVGAGPSLDKNIHYLREVQERSVIFASDAALKPLLKMGVKPPLVLCLDPQEEITRFFTDIPHRGLTLVAPTIVHPSVLELWEGNVVFYNQHAPDIPVLDEIAKRLPAMGALTPGGSVLSVAYHLAFETGCNPILFLGQDLSYSRNQTYSRSSEKESESLGDTVERQAGDIVYEEDMYGERRPTLKAMAVSKQWFDWAFTEWKRDTPLEVFNCSEAGIMTKHVKQMPLREAIYRHCTEKINVPWILKKALK